MMHFQSRPCAILHSPHTELSASTQTVPGGRLIKGSDGCVVVLAQNWPACAETYSTLMTSDKVSHQAVRGE